MAFLRAVIRCSGSRKFGISIYNLHGTKSAKIRVFLPFQNYTPIALKTTIASTGASADVEEKSTSFGSRRDPLDTGFDNPKAAFKSKTTWEVLRAYIVYTLCSSNYLVEHNMQVSGFSYF